MKKIFSIGLVSMLLLASSCTKNESINSSESFGFQERFGPKEEELPAVKEMFKTYDLWLRLNFKDPKEVTNSILVQDVNNRYGATAIEDKAKPSAIMFVDTLLHNVSTDFVRRVFPREFFFVKTYNGSWWKQDIYVLGRSRLIVCWPNERLNTQPITVPETHYYQDSVLTRMIWGNLSGMLAQRMEEKVPGFEAAGMPYDNGKALDEINKNFPGNNDEDIEARNREVSKLATERGYISGSGSRGYEVDLGQWFSLLTTESYQNIKKVYLDTSEKRTAKYKILTDFLKKEYHWDIQAAGNKYRQKLDSFH